MAQYIDKSALVAEIDRLQETTMDKNRNFLSSYHSGVFDALSMLENFLDTLEVKEVLQDIWHDVSEKPELEQPLLIIMKGTHKDFRRHYRIGCYGKRANDIPTWVIAGCYSDSFISKWCYISDILQYTTEVKDVDLEKEKDDYWNKLCDSEFGELLERDAKWFDDIAKHFFELGLKAKGE